MVGGVLHLIDGDQHLLYLVTKRLSHEKSNCWKIRRSFETSSLIDLGIKKQAIPKFGIFRLDWQIVRNMIKYIFKGTGIDIIVCIFDPRDQEEEKKKGNLFVSRALPGP